MWSLQFGKMELTNKKSELDKVEKQENKNIEFKIWQNRVGKQEK